MKIVETKNGTSYLLPFILVTSLFFLWGFAHSILDVLNKHFQEVLVISKAKSAMVQAVVYGGYFLMAIPAGRFIRRYGYRKGVVLGLLLYAFGAFLFIPGSKIMSFNFFLFSLFIIGCGLTCLETAANPYVTVLGEPETGASRLNLAQSFNGLGWILGPLVGGLVLFSGNGSGNDSDIALPYLGIGCVVVLVAFLFMRVRLPEIQDADEESVAFVKKKLWRHAHFSMGVLALFCYVAAQTGINSFFINYVTEASIGMDNRDASLLLSFGGMGLFMVGRLSGSSLMKRIPAERLLLYFVGGALLCIGGVITGMGWIGVIALFCCYLFESIMFPTIFALAIRQLGQHTKRASSYLIMSIVGGAIAPVLMGLCGEQEIRNGFYIPLLCFIVIGVYSVFYKKWFTRDDTVLR
ncbi:MAG: sugar MFS transporter [Bacteroides sp.]|jgi:FHS family L-fucose permease-like MFS transporter|nr:sugar MFS transporter [Bacteroides sp.]MCI1681561.1 sugar MFS transporter [Bacteroides sp.]